MTGTVISSTMFLETWGRRRWLLTTMERVVTCRRWAMLARVSPLRTVSCLGAGRRGAVAAGQADLGDGQKNSFTGV